MDFNFLKLYDTINDALDDTEFKDAQLSYFLSIQLSPNETYLQFTNSQTDLTFSSNFEAYIVDNCGSILKDISSNVFMEDFVDVNGITQSKIEIVNIGQDFFGRAVFIKFVATESNVIYYTRPIKITDKDIHKTYRFDYTNNLNLYELPYEIALCTQSIRLVYKFTGFINNSEVGSYYQISSGNNISTRFQSKISNAHLVEQIDTFTFLRLQKLFEHDTIYQDYKRITDNPILEPGDRIGQSNLFKASFNAYVKKEDVFDFQFQIFTGLTLFDYDPFGLYVTGHQIETLTFRANVPLTLNTGFVKVYNSLGTLIYTFNDQDMTIEDVNQLKVVAIGTVIEFLPNDTYYVNVSQGLVTGLGALNDAIEDNTTWTFTISQADYNSEDYDNEDYFTGEAVATNRFNSKFDSKFN